MPLAAVNPGLDVIEHVLRLPSPPLLVFSKYQVYIQHTIVEADQPEVPFVIEDERLLLGVLWLFAVALSHLPFGHGYLCQ